MQQLKVLSAMFLLCTVLAACAGSSSPDVYSRNDVRKAYTVHNATVLELRAIEIEGQSSRVGTLGGAWIGSAVGRTLGGGRGSQVTAAVGGVAGAATGQGIEKEITAAEGLEIMLELDNGEMIVVVQGADVVFRAGETVRVLRDGRSARVVKRR